MTPTRKGSFRLFRFAGVDVFLHWSWFIVAVLLIQARKGAYSSITWNVIEYLALFVIVLLHEFGHSLACRQVGGRADTIVLWPLGGVAYVSPPSRPGATLWSIAAGPLVNVLLFPLFSAICLAGPKWGLSGDLQALFNMIWLINVALLVFNLLPVYPLDGGQILRSLLWFVVGRAKSLMIAAVIGFAGVAGLAALAFWDNSIWLGILAAFVLMNCWSGLQLARSLMRLERMPRHGGFACPVCRAAPPAGALWLCGACRSPFDAFATQAVCPSCAAQFGVTQCMDCGAQRPITDWIR